MINDIVNRDGMFRECNSIIEMNFTYFYAIKANDFSCMFKKYNSSISLDLSGIITSNYWKNTVKIFYKINHEFK